MTDPAAPTTPGSGYDRRALTDDQRRLADDIASAMSASHDAECDVWQDSGDGCSCGLLIDVAGGLLGARIVEVVQELGYDTTTQRGDRLERRIFNPHPLARPTTAVDSGCSGPPPLPGERPMKGHLPVICCLPHARERVAAPAEALDVLDRLIEVGAPPDAMMDSTPSGQNLREWWFRLAPVLADARRLRSPENNG